MKIVFFGAGKYATYACQQILEKQNLYMDEYLAFADNNEKLWGKYFIGKKVISPINIFEYGADLIVILSTLYENIIRKQLIDDLRIPKEQVYTWDEYTRLCYCNKVYRKKYSSIKKEKSRLSINSKKMVIYTAITGNYDNLKEPLFTGKNLEYVCFTNNRNIKSKIWNVQYIKNENMDDIYLARHIKMNPHIFFCEYEMSIWVDGKYQIMDDLNLYVSEYKKQSDILCFPHPERNCICDELAMCIIYTVGNNKEMIVQTAEYLNEGYPLNYGLYDTGCMVRIHNNPDVKMLMERWENEIKKYSFRDQLSFPYVCWKNGFIPDICNLDINRNRWLLQKRTLY